MAIFVRILSPYLITMLRYRYKSYIDPLHHSSVTDSSIYPSDQKFPFQKIEKLTNRYISNRIEADPKSYSEQKTKSDTTLVCGVSLNEFSKKFIADFYNNNNQNKMDCFEKEEINRLDTKLNFYGLINLYKRCKGQSSTSYGNYYKEILGIIFTTKIGGHKPESFVTDLLGLIISGIENVKFKYRMIRSFDKARDIFVKHTAQHPLESVGVKVSESKTSISNRNRSAWLHFPDREMIQYRLTWNASQKQNQFKNVMTDVQYILQYMNQNKYSGSDEFVKNYNEIFHHDIPNYSTKYHCMIEEARNFNFSTSHKKRIAYDTLDKYIERIKDEDATTILTFKYMSNNILDRNTFGDVVEHIFDKDEKYMWECVANSIATFLTAWATKNIHKAIIAISTLRHSIPFLECANKETEMFITGLLYKLDYDSMINPNNTLLEENRVKMIRELDRIYKIMNSTNIHIRIIMPDVLKMYKHNSIIKCMNVVQTEYMYATSYDNIVVLSACDNIQTEREQQSENIQYGGDIKSEQRKSIENIANLKTKFKTELLGVLEKEIDEVLKDPEKLKTFIEIIRKQNTEIN